MKLLASLTALLSLAPQSLAADDDSNSIVGTWSSKSNTVFTGPGFFDPIDELLIEPALPGISYSFTDDGHYEEAIYQVTSNAKNHSCATAVLIYQHGTYVKADNGSLTLTPIVVDGRQLLSDPCNDGGISTYSRYNQTEFFKDHTVMVDPYYGRYKLTLYAFDGTPVQPLYLAYRPAMMLPTETLNPTEAADTSSGSVLESAKAKVKRSFINMERTTAKRSVSVEHHDLLTWGACVLIAVGCVFYAGVV
ncbi:hypothetical protein WICPIJ_001057 [Wickerhamomyces pijperi]|uniref:Protein ROT1 n=1 Tax=Wickerhamomyces pijperi TaxID=599730 RepID=A0A9P8QEB1_WICPI|nr:hypothetical protein WICPIJ_001057 [Wickerhamomyces pijperi]